VTETTAATATTPQITSRDTYTYDASGNTRTRVLGGDTQTLEWDRQGELTKVVNADGTTTSYKYDAAGERILRDTTDEKTFYLPGMELRLDKTTSKVTATRYYQFGDMTVAMRDGTGVHYLASDHQGSAELAIKPATGETTRRRMDAFGNPRDEATSSSAGWVNDKGFVGGTIQKSTGLTTLGAREYDSDTGRFLSADPLIFFEDPQQINGYAYANNSPVTMSDPSGLAVCLPEVGCGGVVSVQEMAKKRAEKGRTGPTTTVTPAEAEAQVAREQQEAAKQRAMKIAEELADIVAEELGIKDALDCFTTGALGSCGETALNIVSSFLGGGPLGKLARKYWDEWGKAAALGKRIWNLGEDLLATFNDWRKARSEARRLRQIADSCLTKEKGNSFTSDTYVLMADGTAKQIKDVDIGDRVLTTDPETSETRTETVTAQIKGEGVKRFVRVTIDVDGVGGAATASVTATDGHPVWVGELSKWVDAASLNPGQQLRTTTGAHVRIVDVDRWTAADAVVHNITVANFHTYYVLAGSAPVLVHNCGGRVDSADWHHIFNRHSASSRHPGKSKFMTDNTRMIRSHVEDALKYGTRRSNGLKGGHLHEYDFGKTVGYDRNGKPLTGVRVVVRKKKIVTAFPIKMGSEGP
jgi:RHS repeat-associated protein